MQKAILTQLEAAQKGARARTLDETDVAEFVAAVRKARRAAKKAGLNPDTDVSVAMDGGAVANSYKYRADATSLKLAAGKITVARTWARKVPYGDCGRLVARVGGKTIVI